MLRPALLLPAHGFHRVGLLTPGFTSRPLGLRCWSASGLSGDYPCGTFTRRNDAAWPSPLGLHSSFGICAFTTHHGHQPKTPQDLVDPPPDVFLSNEAEFPGKLYVQELLGHSSLETTQLYTRVTISTLKAVYEATHPGAREPDAAAAPAMVPAVALDAGAAGLLEVLEDDGELSADE